MSVPKSERKQSNVQFIVILQEIEQYFIKYYNNENKILGLADQLFTRSAQAYDNATLYFEMCYGTIHGTLAQKKKYCKKTCWSIRQLSSQINILIAEKMKNNKSTKELVNITFKLLKAFNLLQQQLKRLNKEKE